MNKKRIPGIILAFLMVFSTFTVDSVPVQAKIQQISLYPKETRQLKADKNSTFKSSNKKVVTVSRTGLMTARKKGTAKITVKGKKNITVKVSVKKKPAVTRGQWIKELVIKSGISISTSDVRSNYSDTSKTGFDKYVAVAASRKSITDGGRYFHPYRPATREFVAYTSVHILGFDISKKENVSCKDKKSLTHKTEDAIALRQGILSFDERKFRPKENLSKNEKKKALAAVTSIVSADKIDPSHKDKITYQDSVKDLTAENIRIVSDSDNEQEVSIPKKSVTPPVQSGQVILVEDSKKELPLKVTSVADKGNEWNIIGTCPEINEVYKKLNFQSETTGNLSDFVPNRDVVNSTSGIINNRLGISLNSNLTLGETKTYEPDVIKIGNSGSIKPMIEIEAPKVTVIADLDLRKLTSREGYKQLSVTVSEKALVQTDIEFSTKDSGSTNIKLGELAVGTKVPHLSVILTFYLNVGADGKAIVKCTNSLSAGFSYVGGDLRFNGDTDTSFDGTEAEINGHVYFEPHIDLVWGIPKKLPIAGAYFDVGPQIASSIKYHDTEPKICADVDMRLMLSVSMRKEDGLGWVLTKFGVKKLSEEFLRDDDSNPFRLKMHFEDGKRISGDKCTWTNGNNDESLSGMQRIFIRDKEIEVGGVTFTLIDKSGLSYDYGELCYKKDNSYQKIAEGDIYPYIVTDGKTVYYMTENNSIFPYSFDIYEMSVGESSRLLIAEKNVDFPCVNCGLCGYYNGKLYYIYNTEDHTQYMKSYDVINRKVTSRVVVAGWAEGMALEWGNTNQYGRYFVSVENDGLPRMIDTYIYDAENDTFFKISDRLMSASTYAMTIKGNTVYYVESVSRQPDDKYCNVLKYNLDTDDKHVIKKNIYIGEGGIECITDKYFEYSVYSESLDDYETHKVNF